MKTILKLHYRAVPSAYEDLYVNESIIIQHSEGTLQRTIVVDANKEKLSVSFNVRKFVGPSDFCGYGGIRMFNKVKASYTYNKKSEIFEAHIPHHSNIRLKHFKKYWKNSKYFPICTNDSLIFERKFYLDFGKTYFVFYDFNSAWNMDVTVNVHSSNYIAIYNFEDFYCSGIINMFIFNDFFINCLLRVVKLIRQIPIVLQWSRLNNVIQNEKSGLTLIHTDGIWPGSMGLTITENVRNVRIFNPKNQICKSGHVLFVTGVANETSMFLGRHTQKQYIPNAESLTVERAPGNCPLVEQELYAIILTPSPSQSKSHCISMYQPFQSIYLITSKNRKEQTLTKACVSLDAVMSFGMYQLNVIEPLYNIPILNKWIYYSIAISERCYRGSGIKIYFQTFLYKEKQSFYFRFPQERSHYILYDYGFTSFLYFHLERYLADCTAYIEFTSSPYRLKFPYRRRNYFKVLVHVNVISSDSLV